MSFLQVLMIRFNCLKLSSEAVGSGVETSVSAIEEYIYVGYVRAHTHDVRAFTIAVPISHEGRFVLLVVRVVFILFKFVIELSFHLQLRFSSILWLLMSNLPI